MAKRKTECEALEAAIAADFDDVGAHMAYADWLTEQGDPRGEFVQVQLALEDPGRSPEERRKLQDREKALLKEHGRAWLGELADYLFESQQAPADPGRAAWGRLFGESFEQAEPDEVKDDIGRLNRQGYAFRCTRGWLTSLTINRLSEQFAGVLAQAPAARLLRRLTVRDGEEYELPLEPLAGAAWIKTLRALQIGYEEDACHVSAEEAVGVIARMTALEELRLFAHNVDTEALFSLKTFGNLRVLEVNHLHEYPLERLAENPSLGKLTHLLIHPHALEPGAEEPYLNLDGLRAVVNSPHLKGLTHLRLRLTAFGDEGCDEIVRSGVLGRLKVLDLYGGSVTDRGARILAACPDVARLERLDLSRNALTDEGIRALRAAGAKVEANRQWQYDPANPGEVYEMEFLYEGDME